MNVKILSKTLALALILSLYTFISSGIAESFPFRTLAVGDKIPAVSLLNPTDNSKLSLASLEGSPAVLVFWGGDLATKKKRAIAALSEIQELKPFLTEKGIALKIINAQGDSDATIAEVRSAAGLTEPVYLDPGQQAYGDLGIFIMPSVLLLDQNGVTVAGMGYSRDMTAELKGEIEIMLNEKTREQVEAERHPVMDEKSSEEKEATRRLNMGQVMLNKGQLESAQREFEAALASNPQLAEAHVELGCLFLQMGKTAEAENSLNTGLDLNPDSLRAEICLAQITALHGEVDLAIEDLRTMLFRNNRNAELHYVLGTLYEKKENHRMAAKEFRKSYELLLRRTDLEE